MKVCLPIEEKLLILGKIWGLISECLHAAEKADLSICDDEIIPPQFIPILTYLSYIQETLEECLILYQSICPLEEKHE